MQNKIKNLIKKLGKFGYHVKPKNYVRTDPVCGMEATSDLFKASYSGHDYYFCFEHCKGQFEANPANYVNQGHE